METIGLIAGNGTFPVSFAREARKRGYAVSAVAHKGETLPELADEVDAFVWIRVGQVGKMVKTLRRAGVKRAVMAGGINKSRSLSSLRPDFKGMRLLRRALGKGDDALLRNLAAEFEAVGIEIVPSTLFLERILAHPGLMAGPPPGKQALEDIRLGCKVLAALGPLDVGQGVVVEAGIVLAVEAVEGTDAAVTRAGEIGSGAAVVVKAAKRGQDMRFDVPAVGPRTIEVMATSGACTLAIEAGSSLILEDERFFELARKHQVTVVGCSAEGEVPDG